MANTIIKNIIFDLGGVLYEIDTPKTEALFTNLVQKYKNEAPPYSLTQSESAKKIEVGSLTPSEFYDSVRAEFGILDASDSEIKAVWNALLIDVYPQRVELLKNLKANYPIALLSNTNRLHFEYLLPQCGALFAEIQYPIVSFEIGKRKPNADIFEFALAHTGFLANETLFVEDTAVHIQTAQKIGLHTLHLTDAATLVAQLNQILNKTIN